MSHHLLSVVTVLANDQKELARFTDDIRENEDCLIGSKVSKRWRDSLIAELRFEYLRDVRCRAEWPDHVSLAPSTLVYEMPDAQPLPCAYFAFDSRGLGGGLGEYFLDASVRFPNLRFVVQWLYPDWGELGVQELQAGRVLGEELYDVARCGEQFFREVAAEYFGVEFSDVWFEGTTTLSDTLATLADEAERLKAVCTATSWRALRKAVGSRETVLMDVKHEAEKLLDLDVMKRCIAVDHVIPDLWILGERLRQ